MNVTKCTSIVNILGVHMYIAAEHMLSGRLCMYKDKYSCTEFLVLKVGKYPQQYKMYQKTRKLENMQQSHQNDWEQWLNTNVNIITVSGLDGFS